MSTNDVTNDSPLAKEDVPATAVACEETLQRHCSEIYDGSLKHCVHRFVVVGFYYPFLALPCAYFAAIVRFGWANLNTGEVLTILFVGVAGAAVTGVILGVIATSIGGIGAMFFVRLANHCFRFPLSVETSAAAIGSITVFFMLVPWAVTPGQTEQPEFWLIGVAIGTLLCQSILVRTVSQELPKVIESQSRNANVAPKLLENFMSRPTSWQFELRDLIIATTGIAAVFAALRALRLVGIYLEWYVLFSLLIHTSLCLCVARWSRAKRATPCGANP